MEALPIISGAEQQENREQPVGAESVIVVQGPPPTEEQVISQVMTKARQNRSKSCHERSDSMKKYTKRKLAPDEDLITVVTDDHHFINSTGSGISNRIRLTLIYRISSYNFRGNYYFLNLEIVANSNSCCNISIFT